MSDVGIAFLDDARHDDETAALEIVDTLDDAQLDQLRRIGQPAT